MFAKSRKETVRDQVEDLAEADPAARRERDRRRSTPTSSRTRATGARRRAPADARERPRAVTSSETPATSSSTTSVPAVTAGRQRRAGEQAEPIADEARRRGPLAAAALKGESTSSAEGLEGKKVVVLAALAALGAFSYKKLRGGDESASWQSSYHPGARSAAPPTPRARRADRRRPVGRRRGARPRTTPVARPRRGARRRSRGAAR